MSVHVTAVGPLMEVKSIVTSDQTADGALVAQVAPWGARAECSCGWSRTIRIGEEVLPKTVIQDQEHAVSYAKTAAFLHRTAA